MTEIDTISSEEIKEMLDRIILNSGYNTAWLDKSGVLINGNKISGFIGELKHLFTSHLTSLLSTLDKELNVEIEIECMGCNKILSLRDACRPEHDSHISHKARNDFNRGLNLAQTKLRNLIKNND